MKKPERHVVLIAPEIPWNTGNIGRTCLGAGAYLHLIHPLGFSLGERELRRAGLDYWHRLNPAVWQDFSVFKRKMELQPQEAAVLSKRGALPYWTMPDRLRLFLIFGSESKGLPAEILSSYPEASYYIPVTGEIRSLNLSTAVGIALYESLRSFHAALPVPCCDAPAV
jgi:tRNA (cytidine/uridine-2'-O-)-methyltransferase